MKYEKGQKAKAIKEAMQRVAKGDKAWKTKLQVGGKDWGATLVPKASAKGLPVITVLAERKVTMVELDLDVPEEIEKDMIAYGAENIVFDEKALFNWTFNKALENYIRKVKK